MIWTVLKAITSFTLTLMIWSVAIVAIVINAIVVGLMAARELVDMADSDG